MNTVEFRLEREQFPVDEWVWTVNPHVDGVALRDLARAAERPLASAAGEPELAGSYAGLAADERIRWPSRHFLGEPVEQWFGDGDTVLLGCVCGDAGCWPLTARVEVGPTTVEWRDFRTGHRPWDLSALGPYSFDRSGYETALTATRLTLGN